MDEKVRDRYIGMAEERLPEFDKRILWLSEGALGLTLATQVASASLMPDIENSFGGADQLWQKKAQLPDEIQHLPCPVRDPATAFPMKV